MARTATGQTQAEAARALDLSEAHLSKIERGLMDVKVSILKRAALAYGVSPMFFVAGLEAEREEAPGLSEEMLVYHEWPIDQDMAAMMVVVSRLPESLRLPVKESLRQTLAIAELAVLAAQDTY